MDIKSESGLRVLGVNILGRFLLNTDKNIRYVALTTLLKTVSADYNAVQRHRSTIVECLKDPDVSIRRKAMELCFALINANNVKSMSKELILFLEKADAEFKTICSSNLCISAEKYSPGSKWHIDTIISVLITAGNYVRDDVVGSLIQLISYSTTHHAYTVHQFWRQLTGDLESKQPFVQVAMWVLGEYADLLSTPDLDLNQEAVCEDDVIHKCESVINSNLMTIVSKEYAVSTLMKISVRFPNSSNRIKVVIDGFGSHMNSELQQRSVEFSTLFTKHDNLRASLLEKMPPMKPSEKKLNNQNGQATKNEMNGDFDDISPSQEVSKNMEQESSSALLDLLSLGELSPVSPASSPVKPDVMQSVSIDVLDLLGELDLNPMPVINTVMDNSTAVHIPVVQNGANNRLNSLLEGFDSDVPTPAIVKPSMDAYEKDGLKLKFEFEPNPELSTTTITMSASNSTFNPITDFLFQAAVPKVSFFLDALGHY